MKKKYIYKILPILIIFLSVLFVFSSNVFAVSTSELTDTDIKLVVQLGYELIEENGYDSKSFTKYFIDSNRICYFTDDSSISCINWLGGHLLKVTNNCTVHFDLDTLEVTEFTNNMENQVGNPWDITYVDTIIFSTFDIYMNDNILFEKNIHFFHPAPQGITLALVEETTKVQIMEQMKTMIVGFLKYLIVLVVSLLAFWKGWKFLSTQLRKA